MTAHASARPQLFSPDEAAADRDFGRNFGLLAQQRLKIMVARDMILATPEIQASQFQPASLDLRLGTKAYRIRASFLPGKDKTVQEKIDELKSHEFSLKERAQSWKKVTSMSCPCSNIWHCRRASSA